MKTCCAAPSSSGKELDEPEEVVCGWLRPGEGQESNEARGDPDPAAPVRDLTIERLFDELRRMAGMIRNNAKIILKDMKERLFVSRRCSPTGTEMSRSPARLRGERSTARRGGAWESLPGERGCVGAFSPPFSAMPGATGEPGRHVQGGRGARSRTPNTKRLSSA